MKKRLEAWRKMKEEKAKQNQTAKKEEKPIKSLKTKPGKLSGMVQKSPAAGAIKSITQKPVVVKRVKSPQSSTVAEKHGNSRVVDMQPNFATRNSITSRFRRSSSSLAGLHSQNLTKLEKFSVSLNKLPENKITVTKQPFHPPSKIQASTTNTPSSGKSLSVKRSPRRRRNSFSLQNDKNNSRNLPVATPPIKNRRRTVQFASENHKEAEKQTKVLCRSNSLSSKLSLQTETNLLNRTRPVQGKNIAKVTPRRRTIATPTPQRNSDVTLRKSFPTHTRTPLQPAMTKNETMIKKLNAWLEARGKTPTRYFYHIL